MTDDQRGQGIESAETVESASEDRPQFSEDRAQHSEDRPQYGVGPFSVREVALVGVWLVAFIVSFFSIASQQAMAQLLFGGSVWTNGLDWILTIGVPTVAVFLIVLRRFSPDGIRRVGSLGIDQFASVAFSVSAVVWLTLLWRNVAVAIESSVWIYGWVVWVEFFLMLAGVVLTVLAPFIPPLSEDFTGRREVPAHRNARPIPAVVPRPRAPKPATQDDAATGAAAAGSTGYADPLASDSPYGAPLYAEQGTTDGFSAEQDEWSPAQARGTFEPVGEADDTSRAEDTGAVRDADATETTAYDAHPAQQAFWALAPEERDIVDERGVPIFRVGPTAWTLVLEDRGEVFVVRHEDGRVGYLHDVSGVMRG